MRSQAAHTALVLCGAKLRILLAEPSQQIFDLILVVVIPSYAHPVSLVRILLLLSYAEPSSAYSSMSLPLLGTGRKMKAHSEEGFINRKF